MKNHKNSFKAKSHSVLLEQNNKTSSIEKAHKKIRIVMLFYNFPPIPRTILWKTYEVFLHKLKHLKIYVNRLSEKYETNASNTN